MWKIIELALGLAEKVLERWFPIPSEKSEVEWNRKQVELRERQAKRQAKAQAANEIPTVTDKPSP